MPGPDELKRGCLRNDLSAVMPALVAGIHVFRPCNNIDMDGRNKSGHDEGGLYAWP